MTRSPISASIIICTQNRAASLRQTLEALGTVAVPDGWTAEVLVVDNASTDDTCRIAEAARLPNMALRYLREPRSGKGFALNTGLAAATGQIIVFTDDDVAPTREWLSELCRPIAEATADAVAGRVALAPHLERPWMNSMHRDWLAVSNDSLPDERRMLVGANMAFGRHVLERIAGFDTELGPGQLGYGEDALFGEQLRAAGYRVVGAQGGVVEHHFDPDRLRRNSFLAAAKRHGRTLAYLNHHWWHVTERQVPLRLIMARCKLALWRLCHISRLVRAEGADGAELYYVQQVNYLRQYLRERRRPPAYARCGLTKRILVPQGASLTCL